MSYDDEDSEIVAAGRAIAGALRDLGNANAATPMGAIEAFGVVHDEAANRIAHAIDAAGENIRDGLFALADAIRGEAGR